MEMTITLGQALEVLALVCFLVTMYWRTHYLAKAAEGAATAVSADLAKHEKWGQKKQQEMVDTIADGFRKNTKDHRVIYQVIQKACNGGKVIIPQLDNLD